MSSREGAPSASAGRSLSAAPVLFQTTLFGVYTLLFVLSAYILVRRGMGSLMNRVMLGVILVMYTSSTIQWSFQVSEFAETVSSGVRARSSLAGYTAAGTILFGINVLLSDIIVIWRAHVIWGRNRILMLVSLVFLLLTAIVLAVNVSFLFIDPGQAYSNSRIRLLSALGPISSLVTNLWATSLVVLKAWLYRKDLAMTLQSSGAARSSEKLFVLLTESGLLYCIYWVLAVVASLSSFSPSSAGSALANFLFISIPQIAGIYPTMIIVLVCLAGANGSKDMFESQVSTGYLNRTVSTAPLTFSRPSQVVSSQLSPNGSQLMVTLDLTPVNSYENLQYRSSWGKV